MASAWDRCFVFPEDLQETFEMLWRNEWPSRNYTKVPSLDLIGRLFSAEHSLAFLKQIGLIQDKRGNGCGCKAKSGRPCCGTLYFDATDLRFRCNTKTCRSSESIFKGTILENCKLGFSKFLYLCYFWLAEASSSQMVGFLGISPSSAMDWRGFIESAIAAAHINDLEGLAVGGWGIEVEIDETKFAKRKYNRGHRVGDKSWVIAVVERTSRRLIAAVPVMNRSRVTCTWFIKSFVKPGSIVLSDMWKGYNTGDIAEHTGVPYEDCHKKVNHSIEYVNSEDGTCTNTIEGNNNAMKMKIPRRMRSFEKIGDPLWVFCWRRKHAGSLWRSMWTAIATVAYVDTSGTLGVLPVPDGFYDEHESDDEDDEGAYEDYVPIEEENFLAQVEESDNGDEEVCKAVRHK